MNTSHDRGHAGRTLRAFMSVAAALCVIGLAGLVFVHAPDPTVGAADASVAATGAAAPIAPGAGWTAVPSAESVFRDEGYVAPEPPIAQF